MEMGINTRGLIHSDVTTGDIVNVLMNKFKLDYISVEGTHADYYKIITFKYKGEDRRLSVFEAIDDIENYEHFITSKEITIIDFNLWGSAIEIIEKILEGFGGYIIESDCDVYQSPNLRYVGKKF
jgi:hypothetical protein